MTDLFEIFKTRYDNALDSSISEVDNLKQYYKPFLKSVLPFLDRKWFFRKPYRIIVDESLTITLHFKFMKQKFNVEFYNSGETHTIKILASDNSWGKSFNTEKHKEDILEKSLEYIIEIFAQIKAKRDNKKFCRQKAVENVEL